MQPMNSHKWARITGNIDTDGLKYHHHEVGEVGKVIDFSTNEAEIEIDGVKQSVRIPDLVFIDPSIKVTETSWEELTGQLGGYEDPQDEV